MESTQNRMSDADRIQVDLLRRAGVAERFRLVCSLSSTVVELSRQAIRDRHPEWSEREVLLEWAAVHYGRELAERVRRYLKERAP